MFNYELEKLLPGYSRSASYAFVNSGFTTSSIISEISSVGQLTDLHRGTSLRVSNNLDTASQFSVYTISAGRCAVQIYASFLLQYRRIADT